MKMEISNPDIGLSVSLKMGWIKIPTEQNVGVQPPDDSFIMVTDGISIGFTFNFYEDRDENVELIRGSDFTLEQATHWYPIPNLSTISKNDGN